MDYGDFFTRRIYGRETYLKSLRRGSQLTDEERDLVCAYYMLTQDANTLGEIKWERFFFEPDEPLKIDEYEARDRATLALCGRSHDELWSWLADSADAFKVRFRLRSVGFPTKWRISDEYKAWDKARIKRGGVADRRLHVPYKITAIAHKYLFAPDRWLYNPIDWAQCELCTKIGHQRQVRDWWQVSGWECDADSEEDTSRTTLCVACMRKVKRLQKMRANVDNAAKLNRKLQKEVTNANKNQRATETESVRDDTRCARG